MKHTYRESTKDYRFTARQLCVHLGLDPLPGRVWDLYWLLVGGYGLQPRKKARVWASPGVEMVATEVFVLSSLHSVEEIERMVGELGLRHRESVVALLELWRGQ